MVGEFRLSPRGGFGFPWVDLMHGDESLASLGRFGALRVFLGRGQKIRLPDGRLWRLKARRWRRHVCPVLVDETGRRLADSAPGIGDYAITCKDCAYTLIPAEDRPGRARQWQLVHFGEPVADVRRNPYRAVVSEPIPLPALLMAWGLTGLGVMGEKDLIQQMGWTGPVAH